MKNAQNVGGVDAKTKFVSLNLAIWLSRPRLKQRIEFFARNETRRSFRRLNRYAVSFDFGNAEASFGSAGRQA
jgi:hypothetical protein